MADIADSTGAINGSWALSRPPSLASQPAAAAAADGDTSGPSPREHAHRLPRNGQGFFVHAGTKHAETHRSSES